MGLPSLTYLTAQAGSSLRRFPFVLLSAALAATFALVDIEVESEAWVRGLLAAQLGIPFFFAIAVASEVYGRPVMPPFVRWAAIAGALTGIALLGLAVWQSWPSTPKAVPAAATAAPVPAPAAVTPAQPDEPAPLPSVASLLASHAAETTTDAAFSRLFRLCQAQYAPTLSLSEQKIESQNTLMH